MKKLTSITTILLWAFQFCFAQTLPPPTVPTGWERIYIKNVGSFDLPPTMEVQKGKYKEFVDEIKKSVAQLKTSFFYNTKYQI